MTKNGFDCFRLQNFRFELEEKFMGEYGNSICFEEKLEKYKAGRIYFYLHYQYSYKTR